MAPGPRVTHDGPRTSWPLYWLGRAILAVTGWEVDGEVPGRKGIVLGVPHTSNWDFFFLLVASWVLRLKLSWIGKDSLFRPPWGRLMRALGGVPIDRSAPQGLVAQVVEQLRTRDRLFIAVPAAGTRKYTDYWKSGFYWMAMESGAPIVLGYLDFGRKRMGLGPALHPTGDVKADMDVIRAFYEGVQGKFPDQVSRIRLRSEDEL